MNLSRLFKPRPQKLAAGRLYASAVAAARRPVFYQDFGVPDSREGRFELYGLHVYLLLDRLKGQGDAAEETGQYLMEAMVTGLDDAFRELGVGHMAVPKKVRKLADVMLGRMRAYDQALEQPDDAALEKLLSEALYAGGEGAAPLAAYVRRAKADLAAQPLEQLLAGEVKWSDLL